MLPQVTRLRGGVKRATVKAEDEDDDAEDDEQEASPGPMSALTGVFKNVRGPFHGSRLQRHCCMQYVGIVKSFESTMLAEKPVELKILSQQVRP